MYPNVSLRVVIRADKHLALVSPFHPLLGYCSHRLLRRLLLHFYPLLLICFVVDKMTRFVQVWRCSGNN